MRMDSELVIIRSSPIHGLGGFARIDIPAGTTVMEYIGEAITKQQSLLRCIAGNHFIFALDDDHDLDGNVDSNPARFLNHSCAPNCDAVFREERIWIVATRPIGAGEEFTFNYGYDLESYKEHPCRCASSACAGYIVAETLVEYVREQQRLAVRLNEREEGFRERADSIFC